MGIFSRDPDRAAEKQADARAKAVEANEKARAKGATFSEKARAKAEQKGIDVVGAIAVGQMYDDAADKFLIVFSDRVELVSRGKVGSLLRKGAGTETIPVARISSTQCRNRVISSMVEITTSGNTIEFKTDQRSGPYLRQVILDQVDAASNAPSSQQPSWRLPGPTHRGDKRSPRGRRGRRRRRDQSAWDARR